MLNKELCNLTREEAIELWRAIEKSPFHKSFIEMVEHWGWKDDDSDEEKFLSAIYDWDCDLYHAYIDKDGQIQVPITTFVPYNVGFTGH